MTNPEKQNLPHDLTNGPPSDASAQEKPTTPFPAQKTSPSDRFETGLESITEMDLSELRALL